MADGTEVSSIGETESLGRMVDPQEGDSVFAWELSWVWAAWWLHGGRGERVWYGCLDEYLTGGNYPVGAGGLNSPDPRQDDGPQEAPERELFQGVDLAEAALNNVYQMNGRNIRRTVGESQADEETDRTNRRHAEEEEEEKKEKKKKKKKNYKKN